MQSYTYSQTHPVRDRDDVVAFFRATNQLSLSLLADWPHATLILDTTTTPIEQLTSALLQNFSLSKQDTIPMLASNELQHYVGIYVARDTTTAAPPLEIRLIDNELMINSYWPNGCRLIPEGVARFRLQSTNRRITFEPQPPLIPRWLAYTYDGREYFYDKVAEP